MWKLGGIRTTRQWKINVLDADHLDEETASLDAILDVASLEVLVLGDRVQLRAGDALLARQRRRWASAEALVGRADALSAHFSVPRLRGPRLSPLVARLPRVGVAASEGVVRRRRAVAFVGRPLVAEVALRHDDLSVLAHQVPLLLDISCGSRSLSASYLGGLNNPTELLVHIQAE